MSNRTLARHDDAQLTMREDGVLYREGMWEQVRIERSAAGAPGLFFIIDRYENDQLYDQMSVSVPDGAAFLASVIGWLKGNDPQPWLYWDGCREDQPRHLGDESPGHVTATFAPRPGYNQNREDYA